MISATRLFDQVAPYGLKYYPNGALRWPRSNVFDRDWNIVLDHTTIPDDLRDAVCEQALNSVESDPSYNFDLKGYESVKIDVLTFVASKGDEPATIAPSAFGLADYLFVADSQISARVRRA